MTIETTSALVPVANLSALQDKIAKLNRRAKRLGCAPINFTIGAKQIAEKSQVIIGDHDQGAVTTSRTIKVECVSVTVAGDSPVLPGGWNLVARIQLVQGDDGVVSIAHLVPGETMPTRFHNVGNTCDHCGFNRTRNDVFVVRSGAGELRATDKFMQVGRTCISDFLGDKYTPSQLALIAECLACLDLREFESYDGEGFGGGRAMLDVERFLTVSAATIRTYGWVSRSAAKNDYSGRVIATADIAGEAYWNASKAELTITDADNALALAAIDWATSQDANNDYMINAQKVANLTYIPVNLAGIAASIVSSYQRDLGRKATAAAAAPSVWQGNPGERITRTLTVERVHSFDGAYGTTHIHNFKDNSGNVFVWFSSRAKLNTGTTYSVTGTVKKHSDYKGTPQTELSRCKAAAA